MLRKQRKKRGLSMTSLVDVIFLLLLFFMLSSTFSKFSEVEISAASAGNVANGTPPIFLQLYPERVTVNGVSREMEELSLEPKEGQTLLVALQPEVSAQRLTDLLVALRDYPELTISVLGAAG